MAVTIGAPFRTQEAAVAEVLAGVGPYVAVVNDPPWSALAGRVAEPQAVIPAWDMDEVHLETLVASVPDSADTLVGIGGGTALDTAKFLAWKTGLRLVQIPGITSVDAGFTDAVGIRRAGKVRYIGTVVPEVVVLDIALVQSAPKRLNRAGIGDILSCHTGLWDWRAACDQGAGPPWRNDLVALGRTLLVELEAAAPDVAAVTDEGVRFLADAYRRIGAACAEAGHSRFEEGSEHFWAYAYEHATGTHLAHGELIAFAVVALSHVQGNDPEWARSVVQRCRAVAHPDDLGITEQDFVGALIGLRSYTRTEGLDVGVADLVEITNSIARDAWSFASRLPRMTEIEG